MKNRRDVNSDNDVNSDDDLNSDDDVNSNGDKDWRLHVALKGNQPQLAQLLIQHGADLSLANWLGTTPLHLVCQLDVGNSFISTVQARKREPIAMPKILVDVRPCTMQLEQRP